MKVVSVFSTYQGRGPGGLPPPYVYTKLRPEGLKKNFLGTPPPPPPPLSQGLDDRASPYQKISICYCLFSIASIRGIPGPFPLDLPLTDYLAMNLPNSTETSNVNLTGTELIVCPGFTIPVFLVRPRHKCLPSFCFQTHG